VSRRIKIDKKAKIILRDLSIMVNLGPLCVKYMGSDCYWYNITKAVERDGWIPGLDRVEEFDIK
jgi:hypothetical protein